jgi:hypothetical protein
MASSACALGSLARVGRAQSFTPRRLLS